MNSQTLPDPTQHPILHALHALLTSEQWFSLFANRLAKRSAVQKLLKHHGVKVDDGELTRRSDALAQEMRNFRPIKERKKGEPLVL